MTETALILPLEPVDRRVDAFRDRFDPAARLGVPAHITLIFPFMPLEDFGVDEEQALKALMLARAGFPYVLDRVETFDEVAYLAPELEEPFMDLIRCLTRVFPDYLPYGGAFERVIPHLTIGGVDCAGQAKQQIELPVHGVAGRVLLLRKSGENWVTYRHFRLCGLV
ncbi:MAG: 2'-5' RNA ligase family protein [Paracoccaceae bacterium]